MQIYLIRHAHCEFNAHLDDAPRNTRLSRSAFNVLLRAERESPLTPTGARQARQLVQRLATTSFDRLYTSPLRRAVTTAKTLSEATGLTPQIVDDLRELAPVILHENAGEAAVWRLFCLSYSRTLFSPTSPDAIHRAYRRARRAWDQITSEPAGAIAVVSHHWFLRLLLLSLWKDRRWQIVSRDFTNCGVSVVMSRDEVTKINGNGPTVNKW